MATAVTALSGIGPQTAKVLQENGLSTVEDIVTAGEMKLQSVPGFGPARAKATLAAARALLSAVVSITKGKPLKKKNTVKKGRKDKKKKSNKSKKTKKSDKKSGKGKNIDKPKKKDKKAKKDKRKKSKKNKK